MEELMLSSLAGLISGVVSSILFLLIISRMQPKLELSKEICKGSDSNGIFYAFKIINNSKYNVLDLKAELVLKTPFNSNGGQNYSNRWLGLSKDAILLFPRYKKSKNHADYALIFTTRDDLENIWTNSAQFLELRIHGKHCFSGFSKSFEQKYYTKKNCIKEGMFNFGKTFAIS